MRVLLALLVAAALGLAMPAGAEAAKVEAGMGGKRVALVVGNGRYRNVEPLANATNDARLMATTLAALGFTLVGGEARLDLDRTQLAAAVQEFGRALAGAEVALFYYSGHGLQVQGVNWLVPVDANPTRPQDLDFQLVDADLVLRQMDGAGTRLNLVLLDACRNNPFAMRGLRSLQGGLAEMRAPEGTLISYATQPGNVAMDGAGSNSPYTTALVNSMQQPGQDIFRMFNQVGLQVKRSTAGSQQPWVSTSPIDGDFYFAGPPASVQTARLPEPQAPPDAAPPPAVALPATSALAAGDRDPASPSSGPGVAPAASVVTAAAGSAVASPLASASDRLVALARAQPCSILEASAAAGRAEITGLALPGPGWSRFLKQLDEDRGLTRTSVKVDFLPSFACDPVGVLGPAVQRTRSAGGGRLIATLARAVVVGSRAAVTLRGAAGKTILLDVFLPDGQVRHLPVRPIATPAGDARIEVAQWGTPGPRLLTALVGTGLPDLGKRAELEPAAGYLAVLRRVLETGDEVRADLVTVDVRPAASAANTPAVPRSARGQRCSAILERAQLGDGLSEADSLYLRAECR